MKAMSRRRSRLRSLSRHEHMQELLEERQRTERQTLDKWFDDFDADASKDLDKDELKNLIQAMNHEEPSEEAIDNIMRAIHAASAYRETTPRRGSTELKASFSSFLASVSNATGLHSPRRRRSQTTPEDAELSSTADLSTDLTDEGGGETQGTPTMEDPDLATAPAAAAPASPLTKHAIPALLPKTETRSAARRSSTESTSSTSGGSSPRGPPPHNPLPITREQLRMAIQQNLLLCKEQHYLDSIFNRYDVDKSGYLEPGEVKSLMEAAAHGDVLFFEDDHECAAEAKCISYKLKCLDDMKRKGVINDKVWREKRANIAKRHQRIMSPRLSDRDPDANDVAFVLAQCDKNNDGRISRDELFMAIGLWIQVSHDADQRRNSAVCAIM